MQALYTLIDCFGTCLSINGTPRIFCDLFSVPYFVYCWKCLGSVHNHICCVQEFLQAVTNAAHSFPVSQIMAAHMESLVMSFWV